MDMKHYWQNLAAAEKAELAKALDTEVAYLSQIAHGHRQAGPVFARDIETATRSEVTRYELRPDVFGRRQAMTAS